MSARCQKILITKLKKIKCNTDDAIIKIFCFLERAHEVIRGSVGRSAHLASIWLRAYASCIRK